MGIIKIQIMAGTCCNADKKDTTSECMVPNGEPSTQNKGQSGSGKSTLEVFQYQQLEIF